MLKILCSHQFNFFFHFLDKIIGGDDLDTATLAQKPHLNSIAIYIGFDGVCSAVSFNDPGGRELVQDRLNGCAGKLKPNGSELSWPHKQAALSQQTLVKVWSIQVGEFFAMLRYVLNSVNTEIEGLIKIVLCAKCDQIEIKIVKATPHKEKI